MAHGGGDGSRVGPDFDLPDEILSVIPTDPYDQLDLARKITSMAIASRVTKLETEAGRLRQKLHEKDRYVEELEDKVSQLEGACQDAELRLKITREDNVFQISGIFSKKKRKRKIVNCLCFLSWLIKVLLENWIFADEAIEGERFLGFDCKEVQS